MSLTLTRRHNVDRFGYLVPTKYGNVPMVGAVATYRPGEGRFGGAVAVEEGTENAFFTLGGGYVSWLRNLAVGQSTDRSAGGGTVRFTRLGEHRFRAEVIVGHGQPISHIRFPPTYWAIMKRRGQHMPGGWEGLRGANHI